LVEFLVDLGLNLQKLEILIVCKQQENTQFFGRGSLIPDRVQVYSTMRGEACQVSSPTKSVRVRRYFARHDVEHQTEHDGAASPAKMLLLGRQAVRYRGAEQKNFVMNHLCKMETRTTSGTCVRKERRSVTWEETTCRVGKEMEN
jgi:hypothetical protein